MNPVDWLLEPSNPSIRYLALRHVLGRDKNDADVREARAAIPESAIVRRILAKQAPDGHWGDAASPYNPKYRATYWTLLVLGFLGLSRADERVRHAAEHLFAFQQPTGGFAPGEMERFRAEVEGILKGMRSKKTIPFTMFFFYHLSLNEISEILNIPVGTVKSRISYTRKTIREALIKKGYDNKILLGSVD